MTLIVALRSFFILVSAGLALASQAGAQSPKLRFRVVKSYPAAFWSFANQAGFPRRSTGQEMIEHHFGPDSTALAAQLPRIQQVIDSASEFYLKGPGKGAELGQFSFTERYIQLAVQSPKIEVLYGHLQQELPGQKGQDLVEALKVIEPLYRKRIWEPLQARLDSQLTIIARKADSSDLSGIVSRAAGFYGTDVSALQNFDILLNPLPKGISFSTATPYDTLLFCDLNYNERDYPGFLSVAVHEVCHVLWRHRTAQSKQIWNNAFTSAAGKMTLCWLDEALATAIGNGLGYKEMTGHYEAKAWYFDPVLDTLGRAFAPAIESYVLAGKPADKALMTRFETLFLKEFPDFMQRPEVLFPFYLMMAPNGETVSQFQAACMKDFAIRNSNVEYPFDFSRLTGFNRDEKPGTRILLVTNLQDARRADRVLGVKLAESAFKQGKIQIGLTRNRWPLVVIPFIKDQIGWTPGSRI